MLTSFLSLFRLVGAACPESTFFGIPPWYHYLNQAGYYNYVAPVCSTTSKFTFFNGNTLDLKVITLAGLGIFDIILRLAGLVASGFIMYAGFQYLTAQGDPEKTKRALWTIIDASIGLGITVAAAGTVAFLGNRLVG